jgi:P-type Ca2+ transporter type 2C
MPTPPGLSAAEAARRLRDEGPNELPRGPRRTPWRIALEAARDPMSQLLVAGVVVYLLLGDATEALVLLAFVAVTIGISVVQQGRTERVLQTLRELASPRAQVLRDGQVLRTPGREVVRGDLLLLAEGDRVPADGRLLSAADLQVDESLLTGESVPVVKVAAPEAIAGDDAPGCEVHAGTLVVRGQGLAQVTATGTRSQMGRIGQALGTIVTPPTPLTLETRRLVRVAATLGAAVSAVFLVAFGLTRGDWLGALLAAITLAMSMLPEEFPLVLTVFMAMGAWRLSHARVLSRRPAAIEALGAATVLCTDKTGTLTYNRMAVAELVAWNHGGATAPAIPAGPAAAGSAVVSTVPRSGLLTVWRADETAAGLPEAFHALLDAAVLASAAEPHDPMERAFHTLGRAALDPAHAHEGWALVHAFGLRPELLAVSQVWAVPGEDLHTVAAKGAPEAIATLCRLDAPRHAAWTAAAHAMAERGLRVLAVARAAHRRGDPGAPGAGWPDSPHGFDFEPLGLVGLADPLRAEVPAAVRECRAAGVRVAMVTGDHPATALAIARQAGIDTTGGVLSGAEIEAMDETALRARAAQTSVFARVMPAQKLRLVQALRSAGEVVAMTGDGVNDAPALKAAHIGIAMGQRGTDVAREASALVLLEDDFGAIVQGLRLGRRILDNVRKAMVFIIAVHVPIAGLALLPLLLGTPPLFAPIHIAFLELLIDPVCSIVFESEPDEDDVMRRPPRDPAAPVLSRGLLTLGLLQGGAALAAAAGLYLAGLQWGWADGLARAAVFTALVACFVALVLANRSFSTPWWASMRRPNKALWGVLGATAALLAAALWWPPLRALFRFDAPAAGPLLAALALATALLVALEWVERRRAVG